MWDCRGPVSILYLNSLKRTVRVAKDFAYIFVFECIVLLLLGSGYREKRPWGVVL
jgi:hypothetical protein